MPQISSQPQYIPPSRDSLAQASEALTQATAEAMESQPLSAEAKEKSTYGLLDLAEKPAMALTKIAAQGQAKNRVEMFDDFQKVGEHGAEAFQHFKEGEIKEGLLDGVRSVGKVFSGLGNAITSGMYTTLGGVSIVASLPLNLLDRGAEKLGELADTEAGKSPVKWAGKGLGFVGKALGGQNSNIAYEKMVYQTTQETIQKTRQELAD
ncbi:MAG: hypothetical protein IGS03_11685 [Candidatus Sericytochromatia bacterium]|nr:hypothetical protein [Candidatus Sericytochromatia bacterium]